MPVDPPVRVWMLNLPGGSQALVCRALGTSSRAARIGCRESLRLVQRFVSNSFHRLERILLELDRANALLRRGMWCRGEFVFPLQRRSFSGILPRLASLMEPIKCEEERPRIRPTRACGHLSRPRTGGNSMS